MIALLRLGGGPLDGIVQFARVPEEGDMGTTLALYDDFGRVHAYSARTGEYLGETC